MAGFEYLKKFFQSENFRYEEEEGILSFKIQGVNYFAFTNDSPFLQIVIVCNISNKYSHVFKMKTKTNKI